VAAMLKLLGRFDNNYIVQIAVRALTGLLQQQHEPA
jgi:hypothetical protein